MTAETTRFVTTGMHCSSCSMLIDITLADVEGVMSSKTDHATGIAEVTYDSAVLDSDGVVEVIRSLGYDAEPER